MVPRFICADPGVGVTGGPALVLLIIQNELGKVIKYEACRTFYRFFAESLMYMYPILQDVILYLSYDIKMTLKWYYWREQINTLSLLWTS